ncbi:hypothetical protein KUTeg_013748 [Tegillarca granosa]|uniref:Sulfatase N-terminal domain-containing protein n=1 Tax=Tegillarca granosa TaxID=220873 RepID=A0ABQ9EUL7_TEGGR|nr:hypothetical protein KUTeg_013748 [Tegillarca granosa]
MLMRDFEVVEQPIRLKGLTERLSKEGIEFMESRKKDKIPFFLVLSYTHVHTAIEVAEEFRGRTKHGRYGDAVEELDSGIGKVMASLQNLELADNTIVYFTSDNGGHKEERGLNGEIDGGYNGIFKGGKAQGAVEGAIRVPSAVKWPGKIPAGTTVDEPTWQMDMFTTMANVMNISVPMERQIDGQNLLPLLSGQEKISPHEYFVHYCGEDVHAVRYRPRAGRKVWKLVYNTPNYLPGQDTCEYLCSCQSSITLDPPVLYELTSDPGERQPIKTSTSKEYQEIANKINMALHHHKDGIVPVEKQFSLHNLWWQPRLQICCNFPICECIDSKYS